MVLTCCAYNCKQRSTKGGLSFHAFPKDPILREQWIRALGRLNFVPSIYSKLCSKHFHQSDYICQWGQKALKNGTVPSIFEDPLQIGPKTKITKKRGDKKQIKVVNIYIKTPPSTSKNEETVTNLTKDVGVNTHLSEFEELNKLRTRAANLELRIQHLKIIEENLLDTLEKCLPPEQIIELRKTSIL